VLYEVPSRFGLKAPFGWPRAGRSFISKGIIFGISADGHDPGETLRFDLPRAVKVKSESLEPTLLTTLEN
jgi:hypothetical protein